MVFARKINALSLTQGPVDRFFTKQSTHKIIAADENHLLLSIRAGHGTLLSQSADRPRPFGSSGHLAGRRPGGRRPTCPDMSGLIRLPGLYMDEHFTTLIAAEPGKIGRRCAAAAQRDALRTGRRRETGSFYGRALSLSAVRSSSSNWIPCCMPSAPVPSDR